MAHAGSGDGGRDVGHGIVDGEASGDGATGGVDVEAYGFFRGVGFEEEELRDDGRGDGFVDRAVEADDAFLCRGSVRSAIGEWEGTQGAGGVPSRVWRICHLGIVS